MDALVALMILATTITLSLKAVETARAAARSAVTTRAATQLLRDLLESTPRTLGSATGRSGGFDWRVDMSARDLNAGAIPGVRLCERSATALDRVGGRRFVLSTTEICPTATST